MGIVFGTINTTCGRNMLKVTILASFFFLALALQHAESCSSSPQTDAKSKENQATPKKNETKPAEKNEPEHCKQINCKTADAKKKNQCPKTCNAKDENSKNQDKTNGGTTEANSGNADDKNTATTQ